MVMLRYADCLKERRKKLTNKTVTKEKQKKNLVVVSTLKKKEISSDFHFIMWKFEMYIFHRDLVGMRFDIVWIHLHLITVSNFKRETEMIAFWSAFFCCCCFCSSSWKFIESTETSGWMASRKNSVGVICMSTIEITVARSNWTGTENSSKHYFKSSDVQQQQQHQKNNYTHYGHSCSIFTSQGNEMWMKCYERVALPFLSWISSDDDDNNSLLGKTPWLAVVRAHEMRLTQCDHCYL